MDLRETLKIKIDWISIVFGTITHEEVIELLGLHTDIFVEDMRTVKYKDYCSLYRFGNINIYGNCFYSERNPSGKGAYLVLSGMGCSQVQRYLKQQKRTLEGFFADCFKKDKRMHFTRLDIAIDDMNPTPYFTIEQLHKKCELGEFRSRSNEYRYIASKKSKPDIAETLYIGNGKSSISFRFYDKDKEEALKQKKSFDNLKSKKRTEIQLRHHKADSFAKLMAGKNETLGTLAFRLLANTLVFVEPDPNQKNKSRWKTSEFWSNFLGEVKPIHLETPQTTDSLEQTQDWLIDGGGISAVTVFELLEENNALGDLSSIREMKANISISNNLSKKIEDHLCRIHREELLPKIRELNM